MMEEKVIIKGNVYPLNKIKALLFIPVILIIVYGIMIWNIEETFHYSIVDVMFMPLRFISGLLLDIGVILALLVLFACWWLASFELTITDKRVYGKAAFGKTVDLPIDSISAVGTSFLKGIDVGTSSGRIKFKFITNQYEVHSVLSKLLMERQQKETKSTVVENIISTSNADEIKKFKDLLDGGVITQEEFDEKKKQLLGL